MTATTLASSFTAATAPAWSPEQDLDGVLDALTDGVTIQDVSGRLLFANAAAAKITGFSSAQALLEAPLDELFAHFEVFDSGGRPLESDRLPGRLAMRGEHPPPALVSFCERGGRERRWSLVTARPIVERGEVRRVVNIIRDISADRRAEESLRFLAEASGLLSASLDYTSTLAAVARTIVPRLADWCSIEIAADAAVPGAARVLRNLIVSHVDSNQVALAHELNERYPPRADALSGAYNVLRTGLSEIYPDITDEMLQAGTYDAEHLRLSRELHLHAAMVVPLNARGRTLGVISLFSAESGRAFDTFDLAFAEELATRAALAIDNARLYADAQRSNDRLQLALDAGRLGTWEWDIAKGRVAWSPSLEAIHGIPAGSFGGTFDAYQSDMHPDDKPRVLASITRVVEERRGEHDIAYRIVRPDGVVRWIEARGRLVLDAAGAPQRLLGVCTDITDRVEAEATERRLASEQAARGEAERAHAHVQEILQSITDPFVVLDGGLRYTFMNAKADDVAGVSRGELLGRTIEDECGGDLGTSLRSTEAHAAIRAAEPTTFEQHHARSQAWFDVHVYPMREGVSFYFRDVTARKRAEESLAQHARELARSNVELEQFAYVASHDLQEPLRMVASYTQLLARRYKGKLDADADDFIGFAVDGAVRMQGLIQDLLAYSRVGRGRRPLVSVAVGRALDHAMANLRALVGETSAEVTHGPMPTIMADETQLTQLFQNLLGNALKFRGAEPPRVHVAATQDSGEWVFSVRDNGIGIAKEFFDRIFVVFQRLHTRTEYDGNGIGLAICKKIVDRHGGRIWLESEAGAGTTFFFTMPTVLKG